MPIDKHNWISTPVLAFTRIKQLVHERRPCMNWCLNVQKWKLKMLNKQGSFIILLFSKRNLSNRTNKRFLTVSYQMYTTTTQLPPSLQTYSSKILQVWKQHKKKPEKISPLKLCRMVLDSVAFTVNAEGGFSIIIVSALWYIKPYSGMGSDIPHICFLLPSVSRSSTLHFVRLRKIVFSVCIMLSPDSTNCTTNTFVTKKKRF